MARFGKWLEWTQMARDLTRGLYLLTVDDNMAATEFIWKNWTPLLSATGYMRVSVSNIRVARYLKIRKTVFFFFDIVFTSSGSASPIVWLTCPTTNAYEINYDYYLEDGATHSHFRDVIFPDTALPSYPGYTNVFRCQHDIDGATNWGLGSNRRIEGVGFYETV